MTLRVTSGSATRNAKGFAECGDAVVVLESGPIHLFAVIDALGHGAAAAASAQLVSGVVHQMADRPLEALFAECHRALLKQRGAVMGAIRFDGVHAVFAGIGNVEIFAPDGISAPPPLAGVLGSGYRSFREFPLPIVAGHRWMLASDGICARDLRKRREESLGLAPDVAAKKLLEWTGRHDDDVSILVVEWAGDASAQRGPPQVSTFVVSTRLEALAAGLKAKEAALRAGWPTRRAEDLSLVVVELSNNCVRHAQGGTCTLEVSERQVQIVVDDTGPGFSSTVLERHSNGVPIEGSGHHRGLGAGLDSARRLCHELRLENRTPRGAHVTGVVRR